MTNWGQTGTARQKKESIGGGGTREKAKSKKGVVNSLIPEILLLEAVSKTTTGEESDIVRHFQREQRRVEVEDVVLSPWYVDEEGRSEPRNGQGDKKRVSRGTALGEKDSPY